MSSPCADEVSRVSSACADEVNRVSSACADDASRLSTGCTDVGSRVNAGCTDVVSRVSAGCTDEGSRVSLSKLFTREGGAGADGAILPYVGHLQLISTSKIGADCCQLFQYKLTKPSQT